MDCSFCGAPVDLEDDGAFCKSCECVICYDCEEDGFCPNCLTADLEDL